jgi:hypothetical protein
MTAGPSQPDRRHEERNMPTRGFLPNTDSGLLLWAKRFSTLIGEDAPVYGLTPLDATNFAALLSVYSSNLAACDPGVRSKKAVSEKNHGRQNLKNLARFLARRIEGMPTVTDAQKIELGLHVRSGRSPISRPAEAPDLDIVSVAGRAITIRLHGQSGSARRGKGAGIAGAVLFSFIGDAPPADPGQWKWEGNTTLTMATIEFPESAAPGTMVWATAHWRNPRDEVGPGARPISAMIQYPTTIQLPSAQAG